VLLALVLTAIFAVLFAVAVGLKRLVKLVTANWLRLLCDAYPWSLAARTARFVAEKPPSTPTTGQAEEPRLANPDCGVLDGRRSGSATVALPAAVREPGPITLPVTRFLAASEAGVVAILVKRSELSRAETISSGVALSRHSEISGRGTRFHC